MQLDLRVDGTRQGDELRSLCSWLRESGAVRRSAQISLLEPPPEPGTMGGVVEAVQLITGNGWSAAAFVMSVLSWRQSRPKAPRITVRHRGVEISLQDATEEQVKNTIAALEGLAGAETDEQ